VDAQGRRYDIPVAVGCLAASREIYAFGLNCAVEEIPRKWMHAENHPIPPRVVESAPAQEVVHLGEELLAHGGLGEFPVPISTPGFDNGPYTTSSQWFTRDPETGSLNIGNYRGQIKSPLRMGVALSSRNHGGIHWGKCRERGIPLQAALVVGAPPPVAYTAPARIAYGKSELDVAGGLAGAAVEVVRCKTVDILVPAWAEIVIEGEIDTEALEPEAPFGEATGYVATRLMHPFFNVKCITHRKDPILMTIVSQFPPSESSIMRQMSAEAIYTRFLKEECNIPGVIDVTFHDLAVRQVCVVRLKKAGRADPWQAMSHVLGLNPSTGKIVVAVDEDVNPRDWDNLIWTIALRVQPHRDTQVVGHRIPSMDPSAAPVGEEVRQRASEAADCSALMIDATRKWAYPPVSLPRQEFMERAREIWEEIGLPRLNPRAPWFGYELGYWSDEEREEAALALEGKHYQVGARAEKNGSSYDGKERLFTMRHRQSVTRKSFSLSLFFLVALLFMSPSSYGQERIYTGMAGLNFSFLPFQVALEKGFYKKHGFNVQPVLMRAQAAIPALLSGDIDYDTHFGSLVRGAVSGLDARVIFSTAEKQMFSFVVQPEIKTVADLKGKLVGISSFGGTQHLVTVGVLKAVGINPDKDVKVINTGNEAVRVQMLKAKQIHAAMINPPMSVMRKNEGYRLLLHAADYLDLPLTGLGATTKKLKQNPEQVKRLLRALYEALQFVRTNRKETVEVFARWLNMDMPTAEDTYDMAVKVLSRDGTASDKAIMASIDEAKEAGKIAGNFTPRDVADFSFLRGVIKEYEQKR